MPLFHHSQSIFKFTTVLWSLETCLISPTVCLLQAGNASSHLSFPAPSAGPWYNRYLVVSVEWMIAQRALLELWFGETRLIWFNLNWFTSGFYFMELDWRKTPSIVLYLSPQSCTMLQRVIVLTPSDSVGRRVKIPNHDSRELDAVSQLI